MRRTVRPPATAASAYFLLLHACAAFTARQTFALPPPRSLPGHAAVLPSSPPGSSSIGGVVRRGGGRLSPSRPNLRDGRANESPPSSSATALLALNVVPRSGAILTEALSKASSSPSAAFDAMLIGLFSVAVSWKAIERIGDGGGGKGGDPAAKSTSDDDKETTRGKTVKSLQLKYLLAFWALRCGYWMSGPYVFAAYSSKVFDGVPASLALVSKIFLSGFLATAIFGPTMGKASDRYGRKKGTLAFALLYGLGVTSVKSDLLWMLFAGRALVGVALSLLFCAPESWVVGEAGRLGVQDKLGETFSLAYQGDSIVAIAAGKLAGMAATARGPTGPFDLSVVFLAAGALVAGLTWKENNARSAAAASASDDTKKKKGKSESEPKGGKDEKQGGATIKDALDMIRNDSKLLCIGAVQSLFEAAMYVFILQWPPAVASAVTAMFGSDAVTPFGTIFSCFMSCSLLGSILFGRANKKNILPEDAASIMLVFATLSMTAAALSMRSATAAAGGVPFSPLVGAFFVYEACVGMYFPSMGTLWSKLLPDTHRSLILSVFGIPLNLMVVAIFLSIKKLGVSGALGVSAGGLALATASMMKLRSIMRSERAVEAA